ncbi:MAG: tripartite tricarboxylate transporter TctB family protein [Rhodobacteraceae bacterium]|nr:tripartite tricarboxylate transporter TctB family protein [Paracoccaceae bacterium]
MKNSDRIFGLVVILLALAYIASALQIESSFLSDPVGPRLFPLAIGGLSILAALSLVLRPDAGPDWPDLRTFARLGVALAVMVAYAYALMPYGFLIPTALAAGLLSYQIAPRPLAAALTGICLSAGLFILFKYALGLGLFALPRAWMG